MSKIVRIFIAVAVIFSGPAFAVICSDCEAKCADKKLLDRPGCVRQCLQDCKQK